MGSGMMSGPAAVLVTKLDPLTWARFPIVFLRVTSYNRMSEQLFVHGRKLTQVGDDQG